ncbi:hypothetical protein N9B23_00275 [bacterium]|nr:hypothetical protein [bacterium]
MMKNLSLYFDLAVKDVFRLWSATQLQVIIVAGICLPILLLIGLKNGHVAELRKELLTSPVGRQVIFWSSQSGDLLTDEVLTGIENSVTNTALIIPESQRLVFLLPAESGESSDEGVPLTLYSTMAGDPILGQFDADKIRDSFREIVLASNIAEQAGLVIGDSVQIRLVRRRAGEEESHLVPLKIVGILPASDEQKNIGYADISLMKMLETYGTGSSVPQLEIQAMKSLRATDRYESMLLFCFKGSGTELTANDQTFLESRGLLVSEVEDPELKTLYGALDERVLEELRVYQLRRDDDNLERFSPISDAPQLLSRNTEADDDFVIRWCPPVERQIGEAQQQVIGLTLPTKRQTGGWIQNYLTQQARWFTYQESVDQPLSYYPVSSKIGDGAEPVTLKLKDQIEIVLAPRVGLEADQKSPTVPAAQPEGESNAATAPVAEPLTAEAADSAGTDYLIVPGPLLAYLNQFELGLIEYDAISGQFIEPDPVMAFTKARLYTETIDDVPAAVETLANQNFAVLSESSRIAEIQTQDGSLQILVGVVAVGVFFFGVITVFSVLVDSTDRKKGTIGILRVMGLPGMGVFFVVLFRSLVIGVLAALLCMLVGLVLGQFLAADLSEVELFIWKPVITVALGISDYLLIAAGAILCAALGSIMPAIRASRLDPFDAIMEGQFN